MTLEARTALVTGASSGLGQALARELTSRGVRVAISSRNGENLARTADQCAALGTRPLLLPADVRVSADCESVVRETAASFGGLDYLINCAGISMWSPLEAMTNDDVFAALMQTNYLGTVYMTRYALPLLRTSNGMVVTISSIQGRIGVPAHTAYTASKFALQGFFESLQMELSDSGVGILLVYPHWIRGTELREHALGGDGLPLGRQRLKHGSDAISVEHCCARIVSAMQRRSKEIFIPRYLALLPWLRLLSPTLVERIVGGRVSREQHGQE